MKYYTIALIRKMRNFVWTPSRQRTICPIKERNKILFLPIYISLIKGCKDKYMAISEVLFITCRKHWRGINVIPVWLRNQFLSAGLEPVLSHIEKLSKASYYRQFYTNYKIKITKLIPVYKLVLLLKNFRYFNQFIITTNLQFLNFSAINIYV